jgi:hypothetical protein
MNASENSPASSPLSVTAGFGDFNVSNSTKCHLDGQVFARRVDAALYMSQKLGFKLADAAQYIRELPERDSSPNSAYQPRPLE